jgi:hypothetical protein
LSWYETTGVDTRDPVVRAEAAELHQVVLDTLALPRGGITARRSLWESGTPTNFVSHRKGLSVCGSPVVLVPPIAVFWLTVWALGMWHVARNRLNE